MRHRWALRVALMLAVTTAFVGIEGFGVAADAAPVVTIRARDHAFIAPARIRAGYTIIDFVNEGAEIHHAQLMRLRPGVTAAQVQTALRQRFAGLR